MKGDVAIVYTKLARNNWIIDLVWNDASKSSKSGEFLLLIFLSSASTAPEFGVCRKLFEENAALVGLNTGLAPFLHDNRESRANLIVDTLLIIELLFIRSFFAVER